MNTDHLLVIEITQSGSETRPNDMFMTKLFSSPMTAQFNYLAAKSKTSLPLWTLELVSECGNDISIEHSKFNLLQEIRVRSIAIGKNCEIINQMDLL